MTVTVIAEAGVNHNGDLGLAEALIDAAADAGAPVVKFQTFSADRLVTRDAPKALYQIETTGGRESQWAMLKRLELSRADHLALQRHCHKRGIEFLSTPFDETAADMLAELGVARFKIASGEATNLPFLAHLARIGRPLILSTGMTDMAEVAAAVQTIREAGNPPLTILHCVSSYPAAPQDYNLRVLATLAATFNLPVGLSDHSLGLSVTLAAVALGATVIEKHLTLDRAMTGPDHRASLEPSELAALVRDVAIVEQALGDGVKRPTAAELPLRAIARKSVVAARDIAAGQIIAAADLAIRRPGTGLAPAQLPTVVGRTARGAIAADTPIIEELLG